MAERTFEIYDHPSDVGIIAHGDNLKETFENAAYGMFASMAEVQSVTPREGFDIEVKGEDKEDLLISFLNELIFLEDAKKVLLKEFNVFHLTDKELKAHVRGEKINPDVHQLHRPIKAATFNQLELSEKRAKVIFDV